MTLGLADASTYQTFPRKRFDQRGSSLRSSPMPRRRRYFNSMIRTPPAMISHRTEF